MFYIFFNKIIYNNNNGKKDSIKQNKKKNLNLSTVLKLRSISENLLIILHMIFIKILLISFKIYKLMMQDDL